MLMLVQARFQKVLEFLEKKTNLIVFNSLRTLDQKIMQYYSIIVPAY